MLQAFTAELGLGFFGVLEADHVGRVHGRRLVKAQCMRGECRGVDVFVEVLHYLLQNVMQTVVEEAALPGGFFVSAIC